MPKMFERGFYGGKFLPFHKGHAYCIRVMAEECEQAVVIFFSRSEVEAEILAAGTTLDTVLLEERKRIADIRAFCSGFRNVSFAVLDCRVMHAQALRDGTDTWDAETPYVMRTVGDFQAVYSSEPSYDAYFRRAYPFAVHRLVDPPRVQVPISGTKLRAMTENDAEPWLPREGEFK